MIKSQLKLKQLKMIKNKEIKKNSKRLYRLEKIYYLTPSGAVTLAELISEKVCLVTSFVIF